MTNNICLDNLYTLNKFASLNKEIQTEALIYFCYKFEKYKKNFEISIRHINIKRNISQ